MAPSILSPTFTIHPTLLTQSTFAPFGNVIECPLPSSISNLPSPPPKSPDVILANQNTALKYLDVTLMRNLYESAPSKVPAKAVMNMFSCFPRTLRKSSTLPARELFDVEILERHPYTTQTFIPLSSFHPESSSRSRYLVVVAPTLPLTPDSSFDASGPPDLHNLQAYWANSGQAVTYGAGTWHAPMVVVGEARIDFVVAQFANGVGEEDCQEVVLRAGNKGEYLSVNIGDRTKDGRAKL
ncbi:MAG: hypothetical protein LQ343_007724 [Gyalolechia ehrenbergii]|nr:MAG: hypothetical protein LQ343_007724 [Gyalolechia ehrenbergii]